MAEQEGILSRISTTFIIISTTFKIFQNVMLVALKNCLKSFTIAKTFQNISKSFKKLVRFLERFSNSNHL